eukprot:TRINITY_DN8250_c0_g1_i1.p1 TRINITY_DN8250_c0_g1~~TRINITY_DN8250_c0_g1_i1.p1  ORF type:complete len:294 (-),score=51.80 TRINITY_DN8250_c0_g1_i1:151-1032(-)
MGAPKQKWTPEEEEALRAGVDKHGAGKWRTIQKDPEFSHILSSRSNIDLKDKWRNMSVSATGQGSREKSRTPKSKAQSVIPSAGSQVIPSSGSQVIPLSGSQLSPASAPLVQDALPVSVANPSKSSQDGKPPPRYNPMIIEALSTLQDSNGSDIGAISSFIEQRHEVPQNFRRLLSSKLRRLVAQGKIEKDQNAYKLKDPSFATRTPPKQKDPIHRMKQPQSNGFGSGRETVEVAGATAAYKVSDAEAKAFLASEAVKEVERILNLADESECMLQLAKDIFDRCSQGEIVIVA